MTVTVPASDKRQLAAFAFPPLLRLAQTIVLARLAGVHGLGVVFAVLLIPNTLPRLLDVGLPHAAGYFLRRDARTRPAVLSAVLATSLAGTLVALVVLWVVALFPFSDPLVNRTIAALIFLLAAYVGAQLARDVALAGLVALDRNARYLAASALPVALGLVGLLALMWSTRTPQPATLAVILVSAELAGCVVAILGLVRRRDPAAPAVSTTTRDIFVFGLRAFPGGAAKILATRADRLALVFLLPAPAYALYALSLSFRDASLVPSNAYGLALIGRFTSCMLTDRRNAWPIAKRALCVNTVMLGSLLVAFTLVGGMIVPALMGESFTGSVPIMSVILWSAPLLAASGVLWTWLIAAGRPERMSLSTVAASVITLALVLPLTYFHGIEGAAVGVLASSALGLLASSLIAHRTLRA